MVVFSLGFLEVIAGGAGSGARARILHSCFFSRRHVSPELSLVWAQASFQILSSLWLVPVVNFSSHASCGSQGQKCGQSDEQWEIFYNGIALYQVKFLINEQDEFALFTNVQRR